MELIKKGELEYYVFEGLEKTGIVGHCFTTRLGGVAKDIWLPSISDSQGRQKGKRRQEF